VAPLIVTGLFDLRRRDGTDRPSPAHYLDLAGPVLATRHPLVVFADPELAPELRRRRAAAPGAGPLHLVEQPFEELARHADLDRVTEALTTGRRSPASTLLTKDTPRYFTLTWSKVDLLAEAAATHPADMLLWIDLGLFHVARPHPDLALDDLVVAASAPLRASLLRETSPAEVADRAAFYATNRQARVAGGMFGGSPEGVAKLHDWFNAELDRCLDAGWALLEESLLGVVVAEHRDAFTLSHATFPGMVANLLEPRSDAGFLLQTLATCRELALFDAGKDLARQMEASWRGGRLELDTEEVARLYDELLVHAWYGDDRAESRRAALALEDLARRVAPESPAARLVREERVTANLASHGLRLSAEAPPRRPTVCVNMIVRDEAHVIEETLTAVASLIDHWVIVDTGSTDGTQEVVRSFFAARGIPGALHERPWRDFGANRSEALALCAGVADYAWVIDADDLVIGDLDFGDLVADCYLLRYGSDFTYWRRQLFRSGRGWHFEGRIHEYAASDDPSATDARLDGEYHVESRRLGARSRDPQAYARDVDVLLDVLREHPDDARAVFYLAQSYRDAGDIAEALRWYTRRTELGGWDEERFVAFLERARCLDRLGQPWGAVLDAYLACWQARPTRAEPLYEIGRHYSTTGEFGLGALFLRQAAEIPFPDSDILFVSADVYTWRVPDELAVCEYHTGDLPSSFARSHRLLRDNVVPESERARVMANRDLAVDGVKSETLLHPAEIVARLTERMTAPRGARPEITLTITTCKRRELFEQTIDSFLSCCDDVDRIDRWVCVDDGSSAADRERMVERYPFFEFVFKRPTDKGHARSMNLLVDLVDSPWWLHLEDDWHFFAPDAYVTKAQAVLDDDPRLGQVLLNTNYGETLACRGLVGGTVRHDAGGVRYRVHDYVPAGTEAWTELLGSLAPGVQTNAWWPHFSLRPSMLRTSAIRSVGRFDPAAAHFELDFALRYTERGFVSAFFDSICCLHLGPLTTTRGTVGRVPNAYELNEEQQFDS